jgi:serine protease AprX
MVHGRTRGPRALRTRWRRGLAAASLAALLTPVLGTAPASAGDISVVQLTVQVDASVQGALIDAVALVGGTVQVTADGLLVTVPEKLAATLAATPALVRALADGTLSVLGPPSTMKWRDDIDLGPFATVPAAIGATKMWEQRDLLGNRITGRGIGVALIDSGVAPVPGLDQPGKVINGPDLSFESQVPDLTNNDTYGHGTHMAGIIAGRDPSVKRGEEAKADGFVGVAPDAHIVSLKLAAADGSVDVSQVIAAIDWVVEHKDDPGLGVRVLSLSFGTTALQPYQVDPLAFAVENAWRQGIVVVVAAGNDGAAGTMLTNPAIDPYVIAVGAADHRGTPDRKDDVLADFSSVGNASRQPDVLAPGRSLQSLRAPGSWIDEEHPTARAALGGAVRAFRGSGSSQATAVVAGAVALMLDANPGLSPDEVKAALVASADRVGGPAQGQGAGLIDLRDPKGMLAVPLTPRQSFARATGAGSLDLARGGAHVADPETGQELAGEQDIFGTPWNGAAWAAASADRTAWQDGTWNGREWTGAAWTGTSWADRTWQGRSWRDASWTGRSWREAAWTGRSWRDASWTGRSWRESVWTGRSWRDASWTGRSWRSTDW